MGKGWKCGTLDTPLDHRNPQKGTLKLAVAKLPATEPSQRIGSLITNPGGPGGSGIELANSWGWPTNVTKEVRRRFDLVAYDPRGVANSIPELSCSKPTPRGLDAQEDDDESNSPRTQSELLDQLKDKDDTGDQCVKNAGWLVPYMTTVDNVHDLDRLRQAVGDSKLSYLGVSYGTTIGSVYANMHPDRVRSLILHSVVDAKTQMNDPGAYSLSEAVGIETAVRAALRACDRDPENCAFHGNAEKKFDRLAQYLGDAHKPAPAPVRTWNRFVDAAEEMDSGSPKQTREAAKHLQSLYEQTFPATKNGAGGAVGTEETDRQRRNEDDVLETTDCLDLPRLPKENGPWLTRFARARAESPVFGPAEILTDIACRDWPDDHRAALPRYTGPWNKLKSPVLVMNHEWDWHTSLKWAQNMTTALDQPGMVVINGFGHGDPTECSRRWTENYLLHGKVPTNVAKCNDGYTRPFRG
ncbi:alpha/beta fold hydrolase [Streptomyces ovatisporus]|uniref:Alpha/beta fold hydrolase n=1 Tax=Streptomyces ovatisporus TaxID=1128682 RepID=A0ABV9AB96_9ACTN